MTPKEKIDYVKKLIAEQAEISPSGGFCIKLYEITGGDNEFAPTLLSRKDQWSIIQKFEEEGFIQNVMLNEKEQKVCLEMPPKKKRRSNLFSYIKSTDQLLQNRNLFNQFLGIVGNISEIKANVNYGTTTYETNDDLIQLLIDLNLVEYDWGKMDKQTHRAIGDRIIEFGFNGNKVLELYGRVNGKNGKIRREALELISKEIGNRFTFQKILNIFTDLGVPESMVIPDTKWRAVFYILSYYSTSILPEESRFLLTILQELLHPLMFGGDEERAKRTWSEYTKWLKYDKLSIDEYGMVWQEVETDPWSEPEYINKDGAYLALECDMIFPPDIEKLYVYWNELIKITKFYFDNKKPQDDELNELYFEIIHTIEKTLNENHCGSLKKKYKKPFNVMVGCEYEKQKSESDILSNLYTFLGQITEVSIPTMNGIAEVKKTDSQFFTKISLYLVGSKDKTASREKKNEGLIQKPIDYNDTASRKGLEKKWDVLQAIWATYNGNSQPDSMLVRASVLVVKERTEQEIDSILEGIKQEGCFNTWERKNDYYDFRNIDHQELIKLYQETGETYKKFAEEYQKKLANEQKLPLEIRIVGGKMEVEGLQDGLKEIAKSKKEEKIKFPFKIPAGTKWENFIIKFIDNEKVKITVNNINCERTYEEMGFVGKGKIAKPSVLWSFLLVLAKQGGEISITDKTQKEVYKSQKKDLTKRFQDYFSIDYDLFYPYNSDEGKDDKSYKIKTLLIPPVAEQDDEIIEENDDLGIQEEYKKQTPLIYEE